MYQPLRNAGIPAERIRLVENGIDTARFHADVPGMTRTELGIPEDAFVFGSVMRLSPEKNPLGLLDAFACVSKDAPWAWLVLAGDGPEQDEFERRADALGLAGRIRLLGARKDPERVYPLFDCFVLPSLTEGLPLALLEAMACERPVVASRVGQIATVLDDLPAALVPAGDNSSLAGAMLSSTNLHPPLTSMRQRVQARYSVARMARDYAGAYRELDECDVNQAV
jgi:glycosyltransferase involved in cell wall biosynthesis